MSTNDSAYAKLKEHATRAQREESDFYNRKEGPSEPSEARITDQLNYMGDRIQKLAYLISELEGSLEPILIPRAEETSNDIPVPKEAASELSDRIGDLNGQLRQISRRVVDITGRVQL